jgi:putative nucleotidyltransferase with HDIG domain
MKKYLDFFKSYTKKFDFNTKGIKVKYGHSIKVYKESNLFIKKNDINNERDKKLINIIALFHDIGRFEQYTKYKTFNDYISIDHGKLGVDILRESKILDEEFNKEEIEIIEIAIINHNKKDIEDGLNNRQMFHCKVIRDLDKLDIYRVYLKYYNHDPEYIKKDFYDKLMTNNKIDYRNAKTNTDYAVLKLSWIYDFNFKYTLDRVLKKNYIEKIFDNILDNEYKSDIKNKIYNDLKYIIK